MSALAWERENGGLSVPLLRCATAKPTLRSNKSKKKPDRLKKPVRFEIGDFGELRNPIFGKNRISKL